MQYINHKKFCVDYYMAYVYEFDSIEQFAAHYHITLELANLVIRIGRHNTKLTAKINKIRILSHEH